jgi:uncharacterized damage-inducible protein DinB
MTDREFYLQRLKAEAPVSLKVLRALPKDLSYKPHDRSPSAEQLVWTLSAELVACVDVVKKNRAEWTSVPPPPLDEMIRTYERAAGELAELAAKADEAAWTRTADMYFEGKKVPGMPVGEFLWFILFDSIHHRGQLSAYLRPMGGKVPAIYGPSADDPGR